MLSLRKQWPFWVSGVFVGVAEIMNYIVLEKPIELPDLDKLVTDLLAK